MIVDDEQDLLRYLVTSLEETYTVQGLQSGAEALECLKTFPANLLITDITMPGVDGISLLAQIREQYSNLPVIMMTGNGNMETAIKSLRGGAFDFLVKPFSTDLLLSTIERALKHNHLLNLTQELFKNYKDLYKLHKKLAGHYLEQYEMAEVAILRLAEKTSDEGWIDQFKKSIPQTELKDQIQLLEEQLSEMFEKEKDHKQIISSCFGSLWQK